MDILKGILVVVIVGIASIAVWMNAGKEAAPVVIQQAGSVASPDVHSYMNVAGPFAYGKPCYATSTTAAGTLQADDVASTQCITMTVNGAATNDITLTLAASTTNFCPANEGAVKRWYIQHATTSATSDLTIAGGTGVALKQATTSGLLIPGDTDGENFAVIDVKRNADTDCTAFINVYKD